MAAVVAGGRIPEMPRAGDPRRKLCALSGKEKDGLEFKIPNS